MKAHCLLAQFLSFDSPKFGTSLTVGTSIQFSLVERNYEVYDSCTGHFKEVHSFISKWQHYFTFSPVTYKDAISPDHWQHYYFVILIIVVPYEKQYLIVICQLFFWIYWKYDHKILTAVIMVQVYSLGDIVNNCHQHNWESGRAQKETKRWESSWKITDVEYRLLATHCTAIWFSLLDIFLLNKVYF